MSEQTPERTGALEAGAVLDLVTACEVVAFWLEAMADRHNRLGSLVIRDGLLMNAGILRRAVAGARPPTPPTPSA